MSILKKKVSFSLHVLNKEPKNVILLNICVNPIPAGGRRGGGVYLQFSIYLHSTHQKKFAHF